MCILYLMYYTPVDNDDFKTCYGEEDKDIKQNLPKDSDKLLPSEEEGHSTSFIRSMSKIFKNFPLFLI